MLKLLRFILFLFILSLLVGLIYFVQKEEENENQSSIGLADLDLVQRYEDSLNRPLKPVEQENNIDFVSKIEDFEAKVETKTNQVVLSVSKSNQIFFRKEFQHITFKQILSTDLNSDMNPEFWLHVKKGKKSQIFAFEYRNGKIKAFEFPTLKGRQNFGYLGNDSLHVDKSYIVRSFDFKNDPYSDLSEGKRSCYYSFGIDRSFVLNKTLDLEHIQQ